MEEYPVPAGLHRVETIVRRSRFLATLAPSPDPEGAHLLVQSIRFEFPDATHHCWAFVAGPPGSTSRIGMSDDGEPHGTAGRPILHTLLHSGLGEIAAVVTRWYGGVKLGTGGLGRAYSAAVSAALETLPRTSRISLVSVRVRVPFPFTDVLFRLLDEVGGREREERYDAGIEVRARIPLSGLERLREGVAAATSGRGVVEEFSK